MGMRSFAQARRSDDSIKFIICSIIYSEACGDGRSEDAAVGPLFREIFISLVRIGPRSLDCVFHHLYLRPKVLLRKKGKRG